MSVIRLTPKPKAPNKFRHYASCDERAIGRKLLELATTEADWGRPVSWPLAQLTTDLTSYRPACSCHRDQLRRVLEAIRLGGHNGPMRFRKLGVEKWASRQPRACA